MVVVVVGEVCVCGRWWGRQRYCVSGLISTGFYEHRSQSKSELKLFSLSLILETLVDDSMSVNVCNYLF